MAGNAVYYYSMLCPRTEDKKGRGRPASHACNMNCHFFDWDGYRYCCRWSGKVGPVIGGRGA